MCVWGCVVVIDFSCVCSCLHSAKQLSLCDSAVFVWTMFILVHIYIYSCIWDYGFRHSCSPQCLFHSIVFQITCTIQLQSSFNPKITCLPFLLAWFPSASSLSWRKTTAPHTVLVCAATWLKKQSVHAFINPDPTFVQAKPCNPQDICMVMWATTDPFPSHIMPWGMLARSWQKLCSKS